MNQQDKKAMLQALYTTQADFEERVDRWNVCIEELQEIIDKLESDLNLTKNTASTKNNIWNDFGKSYGDTPIG